MLYNVLVLNFFAGIYTPKPILGILREKVLEGLIEKIWSCKFDLAISYFKFQLIYSILRFICKNTTSPENLIR